MSSDAVWSARGGAGSDHQELTGFHRHLEHKVVESEHDRLIDYSDTGRFAAKTRLGLAGTHLRHTGQDYPVGVVLVDCASHRQHIVARRNVRTAQRSISMEVEDGLNALVVFRSEERRVGKRV